MKCAKRAAALILAFSLALPTLAGCSSQGAGQAVSLNPKSPVTITLWHYYNGAQKVAFDQMVAEFNDTVGVEKGIFVESHNQGDVTKLEESVMASINKEVGSADVPNIFASYADTAYAIEKLGYLVDLDQYLTPEERDAYVDSYIEEGRIGSNGELKIFPTAKSTEIFMLNKTDWDAFAAATGASLDSLTTQEGLVKAAKAYYEWTDGLTPDVPGDGRAFYGRDAMANLFIVGSMQLGHELFRVENQELTLDADKEVMRKLWDFYYVPYVQGWFGSYGKFRSDDIAIGKLAAFTGSSTSASFFPESVERDGGSYPVEAMVLPVPAFEGGKNYSVQQGAGMVVTESTPEKEYASVLFLKWFTDATRNTHFACTSGYLPVKKEAVDKTLLDQVIAEKNLEVDSKLYDSLLVSYDTVNTDTLYTNRAFDGGVQARKVLEYNLSDKAAADREAVVAAIEKGAGLQEAVAPYLTDENFDTWYTQFVAALQDVTK